MNEDTLCANCQHPKHKHSKRRGYGCYDYATRKPLKVCDCVDFVVPIEEQVRVKQRRRQGRVRP